MMKRFLALLLLAALLLAGCGNTPEPMDSDDAERQAAVDDVMATVEPMLDMVYGDGNYELEYDTDSATLDILLSGFGIGIDDITTLTKDDKALSELWSTVTDATTPICDELHKMLESANVENYDVTVNILSGRDTLLTVFNGEVTYDAVGDTVTPKPEGDAALDDLCAKMEKVLAEDFSGCEITRNVNKITVYVWDNKLGAALADATIDEIEANMTGWEEMKESMIGLAQNISDEIAEAGWSDMSVTFYLLGEASVDYTLLKIYKGAVVYDEANNMIIQAANATPPPEPTLGEKNALAKAKDVLKVLPLSYSGLIEHLEFVGYTNSEATYGADNCGADWNEQAAKKAQNVLDVLHLSRQGLIDHLKFVGFTDAQAEYGATAVGY